MRNYPSLPEFTHPWTAESPSFPPVGGEMISGRRCATVAPTPERTAPRQPYVMLTPGLTGGLTAPLEFPADPVRVRARRRDPRGRVWIATAARLFVTDLHGRWRHFTPKEGLRMDNI